MSLNIAIFPGDGIGHEVMASAVTVLDVLEKRFDFRLTKTEYHGGAAYYREHGEDLEAGAFEAARAAHAILFGAMGLPEVRYADGTEIAPHLLMRNEFGLFAGVRPVKKYPNTHSILSDERGEEIDLVILRESTEGLFASRGKGVVENDEIGRDFLEITRTTSEKLFDFAIKLAEQRKQRGIGKGRVTCVDKANVFVSMAFFRKIFDERAARHSDLSFDHSYVDAAALELVRKPWTYDVMVMENMFGDILSDLGGGLVGGMGMAPCAEIGTDHALFQPAHGSAPDIAGQGIANPTAMLVSTAMMLDWLGDRHANKGVAQAGLSLHNAVTQAYADAAVLPFELGGNTETEAFTKAIVERLV